MTRCHPGRGSRTRFRSSSNFRGTVTHLSTVQNLACIHKQDTVWVLESCSVVRQATTANFVAIVAVVGCNRAESRFVPLLLVFARVRVSRSVTRKNEKPRNCFSKEVARLRHDDNALRIKPENRSKSSVLHQIFLPSARLKSLRFDHQMKASLTELFYRTIQPTSLTSPSGEN